MFAATTPTPTPAMNLARYPFPDDLVQRLRPLHTLNRFSGPLAWLSDVAVIAAAVALARWNAWLYPLALLLIGSRQRALASLLHEACHRTLCSHRLTNNLIGRFGAGYPVFQSFDAYIRSHVVHHHAHLGDAQLDPDYRQYLQTGLFDVRDRLDFVWRHLLRTLLLLNVPQYLNYLRVHRFGELLRRRPEALGFIATHAVLAALFTAAAGWPGYLLFWLLPYLTTFQVIGWLSEMAEHYPMVQRGGCNMDMTRNRFPAWWERLFIGMHGDNFHLVHHLFPGLPFWNLGRAHAVLMAHPRYRRLNAAWGGIVSAGPGRRSVVDQVLDELPNAPVGPVPASWK